MDKFSLADIKKKNYSEVYRYIYTNPETSKQKIANALDMSLPTVSQHLTSLAEDGLVHQTGQLSSNIGRKAAAYSAIMSAKAAIGVEILKEKVFLVAIDLSGKKTAKQKVSLNFSVNDEYFQTLSKHIYTFLEDNRIPLQNVLGIGLGIQGLVSADGSTVTYGRILGCTGLTIDRFQSFFSVPCRFFHDAECAATSELWDNSALEDAIYLSLGDHLGGAIILDGKLQRGISGKSGTFEHMTLVPGGKPCYCGKSGCAECYCSASALLTDLSPAHTDFVTDQPCSNTTDFQEPEYFFSRKTDGDPVYIQRWNTYLQDLSVLINNLHMVMENTIILGGHITPFFSEEDVMLLRQNVESLSAFGDSADYIVPGKCRVDAVSRGSALPFVKEFLHSL